MSTQPVVTIDDIRRAAARLEGDIVRTPLVPAPYLSRTVGCEAYLKLESLQITGAFKVRGALIKLASLPEQERTRGVIAMSAGNHAQAVAYHACRLGIAATIVMPEHTPNTKVTHTQRLGARVVLMGESVDAAAEAARDLADLEDLTFIHPFDDPHIIAGQGTIALEMLEDLPDLDCIVAPVGGGGLISGIATAAKALKPSMEIHGIESELYPSMAAALGRGPEPSGGGTIADGLAVVRVGTLTAPVVSELVDDLWAVDELALEFAMFILIEHQRVIAEGAGAAAVAALVSRPDRYRGKKVGLIISGGNIDSRVLSSVLGRGLARDGRLIRLRIQLDDRPGILVDVTRIIGDLGANILEISHHRQHFEIPVRQM